MGHSADRLVSRLACGSACVCRALCAHVRTQGVGVWRYARRVGRVCVALPHQCQDGARQGVLHRPDARHGANAVIGVLFCRLLSRAPQIPGTAKLCGTRSHLACCVAHHSRAQTVTMACACPTWRRCPSSSPPLSSPTVGFVVSGAVATLTVLSCAGTVTAANASFLTDGASAGAPCHSVIAVFP